MLRAEFRELNVLTRAENSPSERVRREIPPASRHRWFGSFNSSQALAQSAFANLKHAGKLRLLDNILDEDGLPVFGNGSAQTPEMIMESPVTYLGELELRSTEIDVLLGKTYRTCVECKFTESEVGSCSRPRLRRSDRGFRQDSCDGSFSRQQSRRTRCSLTERGVRYWDYLPELLGWRSDVDHARCPLNSTYQLVRNILAACVQSNGKLNLESGHAVLLYDGRNPSFQEGGAGFDSWISLRRDLCRPELLRRYTWQKLVSVLRDDVELQWLAFALQAKYGF